MKNVHDARKQDDGYTHTLGIWSLKPTLELRDKTGNGPASVRWVDTNEGTLENVLVGSRFVARDFETWDKGRDDLSAQTRAATGRRYGKKNKYVH